MCMPASFVIHWTKRLKKVYWSKNSDNHHRIITEFKLKERNVRQDILIVRCEIIPPKLDYRLPLIKWKFKTDQDILPPDYDANLAEKLCRKKLSEWKKANVVMPDKIITIRNGYIAACYGKVKAYDKSTVTAYDKSTVKAYDSSTVISYNDSIFISSPKAVHVNRQTSKITCQIGE